MNTAIASSQIDTTERARAIRASVPSDGLFDGHDWRISPTPFKLSPETAKELETLGRVLLQFNKAVNRLYRLSVEGKQPSWVAQWLDLGKPPDLIEIQRSAAFKNEWPRVIRPDLLITDTGLSVTELDSVPGGIGLTAWLNQTYAGLGEKVIGGAEGMVQGFASIFGKAARVQLVISDEAGTYRPEMQWLARQIKTAGFNVRDGGFKDFADGDAIYRFFELFDTPNVANARRIFELAVGKTNLAHPAAKAGVRGKDAVRAAVESQPPRILAAGTRRGIFEPSPPARPVHLAGGTGAAAAARGDSGNQPDRLEPA